MALRSRLENFTSLVTVFVTAKLASPLPWTRGVTSTEAYTFEPYGPEDAVTFEDGVGAVLLRDRRLRPRVVGDVADVEAHLGARSRVEPKSRARHGAGHALDVKTDEDSLERAGVRLEVGLEPELVVGWLASTYASATAVAVIV